MTRHHAVHLVAIFRTLRSIHRAPFIVIHEDKVFVVQAGLFPRSFVVGDELENPVGHLTIAALHTNQIGVVFLRPNLGGQPGGGDYRDAVAETGGDLRDCGQTVGIGKTKYGV